MWISYSKKISKVQNFLPKHPFFFTLETVLKMAKETNEGDVESRCAKVTKYIKIRWRKLKLIWINYGQLITDCFDYVFISTNNLVYLIPILMLSLVHDFSISCSTCSKSTKSMRFLERVLFYTEVNFSY